MMQLDPNNVRYDSVEARSTDGKRYEMAFARSVNGRRG
jgi:hypothetical protein